MSLTSKFELSVLVLIFGTEVLDVVRKGDFVTLLALPEDSSCCHYSSLLQERLTTPDYEQACMFHQYAGALSSAAVSYSFIPSHFLWIVLCNVHFL